MKFKILNQPETLDNETLSQIKGGGCGCQSCNHCNCKKNKGDLEPGKDSYSISLS